MTLLHGVEGWDRDTIAQDLSQLEMSVLNIFMKA